MVVNPELYWLIIGVVLFILELVLPGFILFFFALGAILVALITWMTSISIAWQLAIFIVASLLSLFSLRNLIQKQFFSKDDEEDEDEDIVLAAPGDRGVVTSTIAPPAEGRIKYKGSFWRATAGEEIEEGEIISVVSQNNLVIHVERV